MSVLLKLGSLTVALGSFLVVLTYVTYQLSFDRFHEGFETIYRITGNKDEDGTMQQYAMVPPGLGPSMKEAFPEITTITQLGIPGQALVRYNEKSFREDGFVTADSTIFDVFTFRFIEGDRHALKVPDGVVLTRSLSRQIFGDELPLNKQIVFPERNDKALTVTAVVEDLPSNSHLRINALMGHDALADSSELANNPWDIDVLSSLYVKTDDPVHSETFARKTNILLQRHIAPRSDGSEKRYSVSVQPLTDVYLGPPLKMEFTKKGNSLYVYVFSILGALLLIISCINYVNLSIADFHNRHKEIGVRKILGARKRQIAIQVSLETAFLCLAALLISVGALYFLFTEVASVLDPDLHVGMLTDMRIVTLTGAVLSLLIFFSTAYPAYRLSANPAAADLKGGGSYGRSISVSNILLAAQFVISIVCVSATMVIGSQVNFIQTSNIGFDRHNLITLIMPDRYPIEKAPVLKNEILQISGVESASFAYYHITAVPYFKDWYQIEGDGELKQMLLSEVFVDHDYFNTMRVSILEGRSFDINNPADVGHAFIINETAAKTFGWNEPVGKKISRGNAGSSDYQEGTVVGVARDFNTRPLHEKIEPVIMRLQYDNWPGYCLNVRVNGDQQEMMASLKRVYEKVLPGFVADFRVVEDMYDRQYREEQKAFSALQIVMWIVVVISALGIFSLSIYLSVRRMKEFGIRKVLGATTAQIASMHAGHFFRIALVANAIALPVGWWLMRGWLEGFAYKVSLDTWAFAAVATGSLCVVLGVSAYAAIKSGRMNPVDVIRN